MSARLELIRLRQAIAEAAQAVARELEAGRASTPFQEKLAQLQVAEVEVPVRAALLVVQPESLPALLAEIVGHDYNVCKVVVPSRLGYSEILVQERGFTLDAGNGPREFADAGSFLQALGETQVQPFPDTASTEPLRFKLMGPSQLTGLCLLVPHSLEALQRKPALLSSLADQADWVFLAGPARATLPPGQRQAIQLVLDQVTGLQQVLLAPAATEPLPAELSPPSADEWSRGWKITLSLGLVRAGGELLRQRLALLNAPGSELRHYLLENRLLKQLETILLLMDEELQQSQKSLATRLHLAREGVAAPDAPGDLRKVAEGLRQRLSEDGESLLKSAERDTRAALAPEGESARQLRAAALALTIDDIDQTTGEVSIRLSLAEEAQQRVGDLVAQLGRTRLAADLQLVRDGFDCAVREAETALEKTTGWRQPLSWELPDASALAAGLVVARPELRYRGEMPRPTLASRFGSARQSIMGLMIVGSLGGGVAALTGEASSGGGGLRTLLAALMVPLLVVGFLWTYVSFRKKERLLLEKELEKLHEGVTAELRRSLQDLTRDHHAALAAALQRAQRAVHAQIDAALEKTHQLRQREHDERRRRQAEQQRTAEQRGARLQQLLQQLAALRPRLADAQKLQRPWLASWINRFNQATPPASGSVATRA